MSKKPTRKKAKGSRAAKSVARGRAPRDTDALWTVKNARQLRLDGHGSVTQAKIAAEADLGDDTVSKIERGKGVSQRSANRLFEALNKRNEDKLKRNRCVVKLR